MKTVRSTPTAPTRSALPRALMAIGLACVMASGSCWAQEASADATPAKSGSAKSSAKSKAKVLAKSTKSVKTAKSSKKGGKAEKTVAAKDAPSSDEKTESTAVAKLDAKADGKSELRVDGKSDAKSVKSDAKADGKLAKGDAKADGRADLKVAEAAPPAGTMMGAYGQSLMRSNAAASTGANTTTTASATAPGSSLSVAAATPGAATMAATALVATAATTATAAAVSPASTTPTAAVALPATAMMGAAAGNAGQAGDSAVARYLAQRGLLPASQGAGAAGQAGLLNQVRDKASDLVLSAMNFLGVPYKRGGSSVSNGFDCSGFTRHIFEMSVGLVLPRRADEQAKMAALSSIKKEDLKPGDLVFFNTMRQTFSHVGIYVGEGKFIHSPRAGGAVRVEDMREAYWSKRFTGARRADLTQATPGT